MSSVRSGGTIETAADVIFVDKNFFFLVVRSRENLGLNMPDRSSDTTSVGVFDFSCDTWLKDRTGDTWLKDRSGDTWLKDRSGDTWLKDRAGDTWLVVVFDRLGDAWFRSCLDRLGDIRHEV